ncbi:tyrosine-type recombinase/integrase [Natrarchaeobaculum sulfurireducens]|uniref:XerD/XerC family integrase n=1 Tax=Natrarchaeobaculum sulfurireducens TaxID=2044521 RepID=A0A346PGU6_9EURY|nr:site-specific integrase [Natrarchaeobaculum sulfurireducens]AXR78741.1 XerD/XerC family integrase [Natrarchaeobaculum sulfurireducens]
MTDVQIDDAIDVYLTRKAVGDPDGPGAGAYAANAESILRRFADWIERECRVTALAALEPTHLRAYATDLHERTDRGEYTASSVHTYYAVVRAFLSWCVRGGIVPTNPAASDVAESALPAPESTGDDDSWSPDRRRRLEAYARERAFGSDAGEDGTDERRTRLREYALVAVLAHSGARGAELFRVPEDDRRTGATWDDVDFYAGTLRVLGKSQRLEEVTVLGPARTALRRYRVVLDPPSNDWPLFPTRHAPSIARRVRETLHERGHDDAEVERLLERHTATELARERAIAPPAITTEGARSVLKRLCEQAEVDVDGDYLTPRGVRGDRFATTERREATPAAPQLRTSSDDRSIAVLEDRPPIGPDPTPREDDG